MVLEYMEILNFTSRRFNRVCRDTVQKTKGPQVGYCHNLRVDLKKKKGKKSNKFYQIKKQCVNSMSG